MTTQVTIRGRLGTNNSGGNAIPVNVPTDGTAPLAGDWMIVALNTTAVTPTITPPSGWTTLLAPTAMGSRYLALYFMVRGSSDTSTSYAFTQSSTGATQALLVYGAGKYSSIGVFSKPASSSVTQTTLGVTTTVPNSLALSIQAEATSATELDSDITVASPFVKDLWTIQASSPVNSILLSHREMPTPGDTGNAVSTWKNSVGNRGSIMVVIEPTPDTVVPITPLNAVMSDGAGNAIPVKLTAIASDGNGGVKEVGLSKIELVHSGSFVPDLDRMSRVWTMGHRGGSLDNQEHSAFGYVRSAINHVDVMEFSVGRTSDGKYFGLHDSTLNRTTSGLAANYLASAHTWAEISALMQDLPNRGGPQPYMLLDDFINQWSPSHTLMFDPKLINTAGRADLYARIQQIPRYQERVLGKFYHTGTAIADEFHAIGCKVWGYAYTEAITGFKTDGTATTEPLLSATAAKWDYLGMEYGATSDVWAETIRIANGKKVIGHIVATVAQADDAVAKGAKALQVSGVNAVSVKY
jgi:hypothetical protein